MFVCSWPNGLTQGKIREEAELSHFHTRPGEVQASLAGLASCIPSVDRQEVQALKIKTAAQVGRWEVGG